MIGHIKINKNRGWRGLAEVVVTDAKGDKVVKNIFSFSQDMWDDMIYRHAIVVQDTTKYYIIRFDTNLDDLPKPTQQRSVLIKNFMSELASMKTYEKVDWTTSSGEDYQLLCSFRANKNNHTTSDWNCIGIRVMPSI